MSKDSSSRKLLGTIKFVFDKTKSRTLNATQAYDTSPSQIVLGSFPASATKKLLAKDLGDVVDPEAVPSEGTVGLVLTNAGVKFLANASGKNELFASLLEKADQKAEPAAITGPDWATVNFAQGIAKSGLKKNKNEPQFFAKADIVTFGGTATGPNADIVVAGDDKSNAVKDIFYGAITVGTGLYREWQGKYAVLKVDPLTNKAILRVYNE